MSNKDNDRGWGGTPQASDTGAANPGWGGTPQASDTGAANPGWGGAPQESNTGAAPNTTPQGGLAPEYDTYEIEGTTYRMTGVISTTSGEGRIFKIEAEEKQYALKLYHQGVRPNHEVLEKVKNLSGSGLLIDIYAHGEWRDPVTGISHDYEIMEYCSGGSMATLRLHGREEQLKQIAVKMAEILDFAHKHGILHRDVKPANFLFTDESRSRFVLTDWGLAKTLNHEGLTVTDSGRTKIYAAPEMYTYIWGTPTYVNSKADFFSMGMTLLALWMGEGRLIADERQLVAQKQEETLPYPSPREMSRNMLSLLKALTRRNPDIRAGAQEIAAWGKNATALEYDLKEFKIVFSAKDNLIAHNAEELGRIMWSNRELAKKYLYSHQIKEWLKEVERPELAMDMHNIVELEYPGNQDAGLFVACLELNPATPYESLNGKPLKTIKEVGRELFEHQEAYRKSLYNKKNHPLYAYLSQKGFGDRISDFRRWVRNDGEAGIRAIAYTLDPELPFRLPLRSDRPMTPAPKTGESVDIRTLDEFAALLAAESIAVNPGVCGQDFIIWAGGRNPEGAAEAARLTEGRGPGYHMAMERCYAVLPGYGLDFLPADASRSVTPGQIASLIMAHAEAQATGETTDQRSFEAAWDNLVGYLDARGFDKEKGEEIFECRNSWASAHYGPYNSTIEQMKVAAILNGKPMPLNVGRFTFQYPRDVYACDTASLSAGQQTLVADWLTLFYQEEPGRQSDEKQSVEQTGQYLECVTQHLPESEYAAKVRPRHRAIIKARNDEAGAIKRVGIWKWVIALVGFLPLAAAVGIGIWLLVTKGATDIGDTMATVGLWAGGIIGVVAAIAYLADKGNLFVAALIGILCCVLIKAGLTFIAPAVPWILLGCFAAFLIWYPFRIFVPLIRASDTSSTHMADLITRAEIDEAFGHKDKAFSASWSSPESRYYANERAANRLSATILKRSIWLVVVAVCAVFFCIWIAGMRGGENGAAKYLEEGPELLDGNFNGTVKGTPLSVGFHPSGHRLSADMEIRYRSGVTEQTMQGGVGLHFPVVLTRTDNPAIMLIVDTAYTQGDKVMARGVYKNSKGNRQNFEIVKFAE